MQKAKSKKTALAIMRLQPLHEGHQILINEMFSQCDEVIIAIGSINSLDKARNPYSYEERKEMLLSLYSQRVNLRIIGLEDIGANSHNEWVDYVKATLLDCKLSNVTDYFSGSNEDALWYQKSGWKITIIDRMTIGKGINATMIRNQQKL
jgi:cytidyltransferase-like protein